MGVRSRFWWWYADCDEVFGTGGWLLICVVVHFFSLWRIVEDGGDSFWWVTLFFNYHWIKSAGRKWVREADRGPGR